MQDDFNYLWRFVRGFSMSNKFKIKITIMQLVNFHRTQDQCLALSLSHFLFWVLLKLVDLSKLLYKFVKFDFWISLYFCLNLSKLIYGFLYVVTKIHQSCCIGLLKLLLGFIKVVLFFFSMKTNCWSRQKLMQNKPSKLFARLILKNWKPNFFPVGTYNLNIQSLWSGK